MTVVAINGSPHGKAGNTAVMIDALLEGFRSKGDSTTTVELAGLRIGQCRGCHACWFTTPGTCAQDDDMRGVVEVMRDAEVFIFGSPIYLGNVSGTLKTFFDRLTAAGGDPHTDDHRAPPARRSIMVANCGFPDRSQFDVVSLWITRVAAMLRAQLVGEFYVTGGKFLSSPTPEQVSARQRYIEYLRECGACYSTAGTLSPELAAGTGCRQVLPAGVFP